MVEATMHIERQFVDARRAFGKLDIFVSNGRPEVAEYFQPPVEITLEQLGRHVRFAG